MRTLFAIALAATVAFGLIGCRSEADVDASVETEADATPVSYDSHVHDDACGHYFDQQGDCLYLEGHVHETGCGHQKINGCWTLEEK